MSSMDLVLERPITMNWGEDNEAVIYLSGSSSMVGPGPKHFPEIASSSSSDSVGVLTDNEDDDPVGKRLPSPVRTVLEDAELNLPETPRPGKSVRVDPYSDYYARILDIIPDVEPTHLITLLERYYPASEDVAENVLQALFEDPSYPRVEKATDKSKRARDDDEGREKSKLKLDYASTDRIFIGGQNYHDLAISQLLQDFPFISKLYIRATLEAHRGLYAPTHLYLAQQALVDDIPFMREMIPFRATGKSKQFYDAEFDKERAWLVDYLMHNGERTVEPDGKNGDGEDGESEDGLECGCCFAKFAFDKMIQCQENHFFCRSCCRSYAENQLGQHDHRLRCMDLSDCQQLLPESQLVRFLPEKLLALYHRLKQHDEIAAAGLDGLEDCPFCDYKVVIDNPDEKLFRCESADCGAMSCRTCKKPDHLPKSCKEAQDDQQLSIRHVIEEAMTKALMRNCPNCNKAFVKEHGCNKMRCPNCRTLSCYICRQVISGYDHFNSTPAYIGAPLTCDLWDPVEKRHENEVIAAAKKAVEEYKATHPDVADEALNVDLPGLPVQVASLPQVPQPRPLQAAQLQVDDMQLVQGAMNPAQWNHDFDEQQRIIAQGVAARRRRHRLLP